MGGIGRAVGGLFGRAGRGGGGSVNVPPPSAEELALLREQAALLRQQGGLITEQLRRQDLLSPFLLRQAGLRPLFDPTGQLTGYEELPQTPEEAAQQTLARRFLERSVANLEAESALAPQQQEIMRLLGERSLSALRGELPVNPAIMRQLEESEAELRESLLRQLGPGFETSTPGIEALANFRQRKSEVLEGARTAQLSLAEQLAGIRGPLQEQRITDVISSQQLAENLRSTRLGNIIGFQDRPSTLLPFLSQAAAGFSSPISAFQAQRQLQLQGALGSAQIAAQRGSSRSGTLGSLLGAGLNLFGTLGAARIGSGGSFFGF